MKKFLSLILALLMLVSISVPALADIDDPYDLVMADSSIDNLGDDGQMLHGYTYYYKLTNGDETIKIDKRDFKIEYELAKGCDKYVADYGLKDGKFFITVVSSSDATPDDPGYIDFKFSVTAKSDWEKRDIAKGDEFLPEATEVLDITPKAGFNVKALEGDGKLVKTENGLKAEIPAGGWLLCLVAK